MDNNITSNNVHNNYNDNLNQDPGTGIISNTEYVSPNVETIQAFFETYFDQTFPWIHEFENLLTKIFILPSDTRQTVEDIINRKRTETKHFKENFVDCLQSNTSNENKLKVIFNFSSQLQHFAQELKNLHQQSNFKICNQKSNVTFPRFVVLNKLNKWRTELPSGFFEPISVNLSVKEKDYNVIIPNQFPVIRQSDTNIFVANIDFKIVVADLKQLTMKFDFVDQANQHKNFEHKVTIRQRADQLHGAEIISVRLTDETTLLLMGSFFGKFQVFAGTDLLFSSNTNTEFHQLSIDLKDHPLPIELDIKFRKLQVHVLVDTNLEVFCFKNENTPTTKRKRQENTSSQMMANMNPETNVNDSVVEQLGHLQIEMLQLEDSNFANHLLTEDA
mmetsp:Transcript_21767/g.30453  ORF Transcript_21767/g.30453 Transcript_21767/m.30453 type:complete len:389 (+) Transcript_21767:46-1212(+)